MFSRFFKSTGWAALVSDFAHEEIPKGKKYPSMSFIHIGGMRVRGELLAVAAEQGLFLQDVSLRRVFRPALLIPWDKMENYREEEMPLLGYHRFRVSVRTREGHVDLVLGFDAVGYAIDCGWLKSDADSNLFLRVPRTLLVVG